jgi:hypothetical protein
VSGEKSFAIYEKKQASGNVGYRVDLGLVNGKRTFKNFLTREKAQDFRRKCLKAEAQKHPSLLAEMDDVTRHEVLAGLARLKEYRATITDAVDFFLKHSHPVKADATIGEVIDEFKNVKRKAGLSQKYLQTARSSFFVPFRDHFKNCLITEVTAEACEKYIYKRKEWNNTSRATHIRHFNVLFNFAIEKAGTANLRGNPNVWCSDHECSGDIFVDHDRNIRYESQIGVKPASGHGGGVVGNRLCTIGEGVLRGSDPTKVLWKSDLPWLTDWYGNAPTGAPEDFTATNGSVFPGQTIVKDGWLRHFSGGNNHFTILCKCWYGPLLECRNLQTLVDASGQCSVSMTVRNIGSLPGAVYVSLLVDGKSVAREQYSLERDAEITFHWKVPIPTGIHTLSIADLSSTVKH